MKRRRGREGWRSPQGCSAVSKAVLISTGAKAWLRQRHRASWDLGDPNGTVPMLKETLSHADITVQIALRSQGSVSLLGHSFSNFGAICHAGNCYTLAMM